MKKFCKDFLAFLMPFLCVCIAVIPFLYVGFQTGELRDFDELIERQRSDRSVKIGMGYNEQTGYYKIQNANYYQADVIALGTSRVMQFRADHFSGSFYNCGGGVAQNYREYLYFLTDLQYKPKMILLGMDSWVFNDAWNRQLPVLTSDMPVMMIERNKTVMLRDIIKDFVAHKWELKSVKQYPNNYGFNGCIKNSGFRWDGSNDYGILCQELEQDQNDRFQDTFDRIAKGSSRFEWGNHADPETKAYLEELLRYCRENGIEVVGFATPFAPCVYEMMIQSEKYGYLSEIDPICEALFEQYGYSYFDYANAAVLGMDDTYFIDGFHGSEVAYAVILKDMADRVNSLGKYVDRKRVEELLEKRKSNLVLPEDSAVCASQ